MGQLEKLSTRLKVYADAGANGREVLENLFDVGSTLVEADKLLEKNSERTMLKSRCGALV